MNPLSERTKLSKATLDMKFMKKSKEKFEKEQEDAESKALYSNCITDQMRKGEVFHVIDTGISTCVTCIEGRLSFKGFNSEIENLMNIEYEAIKKNIEKRKETDISDQEMAEKYKKYKIKSVHKEDHHRRKFLKPKD